MKKKLIIIIIVIIISECAAVLTIIALLMKTSNLNKIETFTEQKLRNNTTNTYNIKAEVDINENLVYVKEDLVLNKPETSILVYVPSQNKVATRIKKVTYNEKQLSASLKDTNLWISSDEPIGNIHIEFEFEPDKAYGTISYSNSMLCLTNFLITPSIKKDNKPIEAYSMNFGDPYIYGINNYYVIFKINKELNVTAPGIKEEYHFGAKKVTIFQAANLRDFPAVLYKTADVYEEKYGDINFVFINSKATKENVYKAFDFATKNIGPYPYGYFYIVKTPLDQSGMEFSNMIFISDKCFNYSEELKRVTYHEVFHQWFYGIIGTDQLNEPFFDEGMVNYLAISLSLNNISNVYNSGFIGLKLKNYISREEYYNLAYNNSAIYFHTIHEKLGNNFYRVLQKLYKDKKFDIAYFSDFTRYVNEFSRGN